MGKGGVIVAIQGTLRYAPTVVMLVQMRRRLILFKRPLVAWLYMGLIGERRWY